MSDDMLIEVEFGRDLEASNGSGTTRCGMKLSYNVPIKSDTEDIIAAAKEQYAEMKALIFTELGLAFNQEASGTVVEMFPGAVPVADFSSTPAPPPQLTTVVDNTLTQPAAPAQQEVAAHLGNHVVPPTGEADLQTNEPRQPLPDASTLTEWNDQCWYMLITQPHDWIDHRGNKKSEDFPDFTAKSKEQFPEKGTLGAARPHGLYLRSKFGPAPAWVLDSIHLIDGVIEQA